MGIEMRLCAKCNGKGKLFNFDHCYNPKNKSIKFLNSENELKTWAECMSCKRFTGGFLKPVDFLYDNYNEKVEECIVFDMI